MTTFEKWWDNVSEKLADRGVRQVAYHAWHAALDTTRGSQAPADDSLTTRRLDAHERALNAISTVQSELLRRLEALESPASDDPCKDGFCPVELFRPIDDTEGSN